jgi:hypothetical protein
MSVYFVIISLIKFALTISFITVIKIMITFRLHLKIGDRTTKNMPEANYTAIKICFRISNTQVNSNSKCVELFEKSV